MYLQQEMGVHVLRQNEMRGVYQVPTEANYNILSEGIHYGL